MGYMHEYTHCTQNIRENKLTCSASPNWFGGQTSGTVPDASHGERERKRCEKKRERTCYTWTHSGTLTRVCAGPGREGGLNLCVMGRWREQSIPVCAEQTLPWIESDVCHVWVCVFGCLCTVILVRFGVWGLELSFESVSFVFLFVP